VIFRRRRFADVIARQLDLFVLDRADLVDDARCRLELYNRADRDEAEELYGDYVDALETGAEILAELRDAFGRTLDVAAREEYEREFNRAAAGRLPDFALELENR